MLPDTPFGRALALAALSLLASILFYFACLNHVSINEVGVAYDSRNGTIAVQQPGWHVTHPLVRATTISTLPFRVDLTMGSTRSIPERVLTVKLVRFLPEHMAEFIATEGFHYMDHGMGYTFGPYVFSGKAFPFLEIIQ